MDRRLSRTRQGGQVMVLFVIAIFAIIGMVGVVLDGGSVFAQRRDQQTVADLAAMAGANAYLNATGTTSARVAYAESIAESVATANGYTDDGVSSVSMSVTVTPLTFFTDVTVDLTKQHRNNFASVLGMATWDVSVTASARSTSQANGARGPLPLMFNAEAFPGALCNEDIEVCAVHTFQAPHTGTEDVPQDATSFNWTVFCTADGNPCNINSSTASGLINGIGANKTVFLNDTIAPLNAGSHTTLYGNMNQHVGDSFPVPIVDDDGLAVGWAYFKLVSIEGDSEKVVKGYFVSPINGEQLVVGTGRPAGTLFTGSYFVRLTN